MKGHGSPPPSWIHDSEEMQRYYTCTRMNPATAPSQAALWLTVLYVPANLAESESQQR